ncbi:MAG: sporulation protein [Oscillospiraceae bacterium]|nr:sporulation protein [Oscillospiraceae bacterium]
MKKLNYPPIHLAAVAAAFGAMVCLIFAPAEAIESARYGLSLCAELIVPSLLPFFAASALLVRLQVPALLGALLAPLAGKLWGVSGAGASAFLSGICGGYPLGAQTVAEMYENRQLSKPEAERLLAFCNNSGPSFCIGVIGSGVFGNYRAGIALYAIHILSAALVGVLFRAKTASAPPLQAEQPPPFSAAFVVAIRQSVSAVLSVCGFVVCFCVLAGLMESLGVFGAAAEMISGLFHADKSSVHAFLTGLLELGSGIGRLRGLPPSAALFSLAAFLTGWGGLSVQFQTSAVLSETELSLRRHLIGRVLSGVISALLALLIGKKLFPPG